MKYVKQFLVGLAKLSCMSCSGWGHVTTCYRNGKVKSKLGCPTQDLIDTIYKLRLVDRLAYTQELNLLNPGVAFKLNKIKYNTEDQLGWVNPGTKRQRTDAGI